MSVRFGLRQLRFRVGREFPPTLLAVALVLAGSCSDNVVSAQVPPAAPGGAIVGQVTDTLGAPLGYCFVHLEDAPSAVLCDSAGQFRLAGLSREVATFEVRRLGYVPGRFTVTLVPGEDLRVTVELAPIATTLQPINVTAEPASAFTPWVAEHGFYDRMRGVVSGIFITPEEWEALKPYRVTDALSNRPGIMLTYTGGGTHKEPIAVVYGRNGCLLNVFVDGLEIRGVYDIQPDTRRGGVSFYGASPIANVGGGSSRPAPVTGLGIDAFIQPWEIAAIEVYPSGPQTPSEFRTTNECGAIAIWTKVATRRAAADSARTPRPPL
jgi:hypothetical protein